MKRAALAAALLLSCSAALPPPGRALCYAVADQVAQQRVDRECTAQGHEFASCPVRDDILDQLQREQELCQ